MNSTTARMPYGAAAAVSAANESDSRLRSGSSQIAFTYRAPSAAAASSAGP